MFEVIARLRERARQRQTEAWFRDILARGGTIVYRHYGAPPVEIDSVRTESDGELAYHTTHTVLTDGLEWFRILDPEAVYAWVPDVPED